MRHRLNLPISFLIVVIWVGFSSRIFAISPENLAEKVKSTIERYYYEELDVSIPSEAHVVIEGEVNTLYDKYKIFEIVAKISGVREITNNILVDTKMTPDGIIRDNIRDELQYVSSILDPERIEIAVNNGVVVLKGKVSFNREKIMARTVASWQKGVRSVINEIEVLPPQKAKSDENLRDILQAVLNDQFALEENVTFSVEAGVVTLSGTVEDLWSKINIETEFEDIIGIKKVINNLNVESS